MKFFGTPAGRMVTGAVLVLAGVVDLVTGKQSVILGVGLTAVGAANCLKGLLDRRFANRNAKPS